MFVTHLFIYLFHIDSYVASTDTRQNITLCNRKGSRSVSIGGSNEVTVQNLTNTQQDFVIEYQGMCLITPN